MIFFLCAENEQAIDSLSPVFTASGLSFYKILSFHY